MSTVVSDEKATAKTAPKEYRQFIGGDWVGASSGATYADRNPFTGETMATIPASSREDAKRAVQAAADAGRDVPGHAGPRVEAGVELLVAQRRVVLVLLNADGLVEEPGRHLVFADPHFHRLGPRARVRVGQQRHRRDLVRTMAPDA